MNPTQPTDERELLDLIGAVLNGTADGDQQQRLADWLRHDPAARRAYRRYVALHAALRLRYKAAPAEHTLNEGPAACALSTPYGAGTKRPGPGRLGITLVLGGALAAMLLIGLMIYREALDQGAGGAAASPGVARILRSEGARWVEEGLPVMAGAWFGPGKLELSHGFVELGFDDDATALLQAPVRLELVGRRHIALHGGRLVVRADRARGEFVVQTPKTTVTDLGTEFGVGVGPSGDTQVQVFEGKVVAEWKAPDGRAAGRRELDAGQAIRIARRSEDAESIAFSDDRFVRTFPVIESERPGGPIYNRSRVDAVHIVPAAAPIAVDGSLAEWDLSRAFHSACTEPYDRTYYVRGAMMYDSERLYIGAHVGDPAPMRNIRDVATDPEMVWEGGSVVVRLSTDATLGWPLLPHLGYAYDTPGGTTAHSNTSIVHLVMWHDAKSGRARLGMQYGLDYHGLTYELSGWQGAFRRDEDGRGYTMEYAIPWALLNPRPAPPRGGEVTAASWVVHWSDAGGRIGRGYLVEVTNPEEPRYDLMLGRTWGKAIFHGRGE